RVLLPADHPEEVFLGTNFGLAVSTDGGAHFRLVCEESIVTGGENVTQYVMGPPPASALYALSLNQLAVSVDGGCTWSAASGTWNSPTFTDLFVDPTDGNHVFAVASALAGPGSFASSLWDSKDAGRTFTGPRFSAAAGVLITGVESAASDPATVYLTEFGDTPAGVVAQLARSSDGGTTFQETSLLDALGVGEPRLAAVDPSDARVIYYRVIGDSSDRLAISRDGGQTAHVALSVNGFMTTFLRRSDGALLVGTQVQGAFASHDGGETFLPWPEAPHLRALAERAGVLYAAADNAADGYALGASNDGGMTWTPLVRFANLCGIASCGATVASTCQAAWSRLVSQLAITGCADEAAPAKPASSAPPARAAGCSHAEGTVSPNLFGISWLVLSVLAGRRIGRRAENQRDANPERDREAQPGAPGDRRRRTVASTISNGR
ncbi:MAG TPA: hypothetical protein VMU50_09160, partial [Polyangia bacterium]|nr:hypothetical protein [Polyangia bacterium]